LIFEGAVEFGWSRLMQYTRMSTAPGRWFRRFVDCIAAAATHYHGINVNILGRPLPTASGRCPAA
jgi:hypothetical protein